MINYLMVELIHFFAHHKDKPLGLVTQIKSFGSKIKI